MFTILGVIAAWVAAVVGYVKAREFVRNRLRYVDSVHRTFVPLKVGSIAAVATLPIAWLLPGITAGAALLFGAAVGCGVAAGRRDLRRLPGYR